MAPSKALPSFSGEDFPRLEALSLKSTPLTEAFASSTKAAIKPVQTSRLLTIPLEIRNGIYQYLLVHGQRIDITVRHQKRHQGFVPVARFKNYVPDMKNVSILRVCQQTEREGMDFMYSSNHFFSKADETISKLLELLGELGTSCIRYLDLNMHFLMKIHNPHVWANNLAFIVNQLPSLTKFCLKTKFSVSLQPLVETPGTDRFGQERRALLKFGAFLTHRHPVLKRLIWPANSGRTNEPGERDEWEWETVNKQENRGDAAEKPFEDVLLNSTAIRRVAWLDLDTRPISDFAIDKNLPSSEVEETNEYYDLVHQFGYLTRGELKKQDADHLPSIDKMIRDAERYTMSSGRGRIAHRRKQRGDYSSSVGRGKGGTKAANLEGSGDGYRGIRQRGKFRRGWGPLGLDNRRGRGGYY